MLAAGQTTFEDNVHNAAALFDLLLRIEQCDKPVLARVNGTAVGGGVGLLSSCDIVIAVERAKFGFSEVRLGIVPAMIAPFVLRKIGLRNGRELFLTGERFTAVQAKEFGLVQYVVAEEGLEAQVDEIVAQLLLGAPGAQAAIKQLLRHIEMLPIAETRQFTTHLIASRRESAEGIEGISAFLQKRSPAWIDTNSLEK
jgi:methylglutaconyl-CoA hydratase